MHLVIVDDLITDQKRLADLIEANAEDKEERVEISCFSSGEEFLAAFQPGKFSAVFLDIVMGKIGGMETARRIREQDKRLPIIFTTTEPDFAIDGYEFHALQYLLKPIQPDKLARAMKELREELASPIYIEVPVMVGSSSTVSRPIILDEILHAESINRCVVIHTVKGDVSTNLSLGELKERLPDGPRFYEYGRGQLVNLSQVISILENGEIRMKNGTILYCSRRKQKEAPRVLADYLFAQLRRRAIL